MLVFVVVLVIIGLVKKQTRRYWLHAVAAIIIQNVIMFLFSGGGTLENPTGDGLITAIVRKATNDGIEMAGLAVVAILLGWVVPIWLARRGYISKNKEELMNP